MKYPGYVADSGAHVIRRITPEGVVVTVAGGAMISGTADGTAARFDSPRGVAVDKDGNVYVADTGNNTVRKITPAGVTSTLAGYAGLIGNENGTGTFALFNNPHGLCVDADGNLFVADTMNDSIRAVTSAGVVTLFAGGGGSFGSADGTREQSQFNLPNGIAVAPNGDVMVADSSNGTIRRISASGMTSTAAGVAGETQDLDGDLSIARFTYPFGIAADATGALWITEGFYNTVRRITTDGLVERYAGLRTANAGSADGPRLSCQFYFPGGIAVDASGNVFVTDTMNHTIRRISTAGTTTTFAGTAGVPGAVDGVGTAARFGYPYGLTIDANGTLYVADTGNCTIRRITPNGEVSTLAGSATSGGAQDGTGTGARFYFPYGVAADAHGNVFVADTDNGAIRLITPDARVTTIGGKLETYGCAEGVGSAARFNSPQSIACAPDGTIYFTDRLNNVVFKGVPDVRPVFAAEPGSYTVRPGATVAFDCTVTGNNLSYQWLRNGVVVPAATTSSLILTNVQAAQAGQYTVYVSNSAGSNTSNAGTLTLSTTATLSRISNLSILAKAGTGGEVLQAGFSIGGAMTVGTKSLLIRAVGPTLRSLFSMPSALSDPELEVHSGGEILVNGDWAGDPQITTVGNARGAFPFESAISKDAAIYGTNFTGGSALVSGKGGETGQALVEIYDAVSSDDFTPTTRRLINISAMGKISGAETLSAGFVIEGSTAKTLLIRGIGPALRTLFAIPNALTDTKVEIYSNSRGVKIKENDNWGGDPLVTELGNKASAFGLPAASLDAAIIVTLQPGENYSAVVSSADGGSGLTLVEVYEIE